MRSYAVLICLTSFAWADVQDVSYSPVYDYISKYGIPRAEEIRRAEEQSAQNKIIGGVPAALGQYPFQAGLIGDIIGSESRTVCGGSLVSDNRVVTAAHCWRDGVNQVWRFTVVLGSVLLFSGGTRVETSVVASHPNWSALLARNDIAVIYLQRSIYFLSTIAPVSLPIGAELSETFAGESAIAVGFGLTRNDGAIQPDQSLNHVRLNIITNNVCSFSFPLIIQPSHLCTSSIGGFNTCRGDSGGPLLYEKNGRHILIGVSSFGSGLGCEANLPAAFTRVTSYVDFIRSHMYT